MIAVVPSVRYPVATIVRVIQPDEPFYVIPFPLEPVPGLQEAGSWIAEYGNDAAYAMIGEAYFESLDTGEPVPIQVQVGSASAGASLRVAVDQARETLGVFGLADHVVWLTLKVYQL